MPLFQTLYSRGCTPNIHRVRDGKRTREASWAGHALGPQEGSHDLSVRPYFPAEMLASCSQIYFFHRSCKPRIPREISPFLNGGKEFHFQEKKKCGGKHYILKYRYVWTGQPWIEICCLACISISLYSFPKYPLISPLAPRAPQTNFWWQSAFYCTESFHGHIGNHTCQEGTRDWAPSVPSLWLAYRSWMYECLLHDWMNESTFHLLLTTNPHAGDLIPSIQMRKLSLRPA